MQAKPIFAYFGLTFQGGGVQGGGGTEICEYIYIYMYNVYIYIYHT